MDPEALEYLRRHSGLTLSAAGVFSFRGAVVPNSRVQDLFHAGLEVRDDGDVTLTVGAQWAYVTCAGAARFVDSLGVVGAGLSLSLKGGRRLVSSAPVIAYGPDERFYIWSEPEASPCVLTRAAHQQLAGLLEERVAGSLSLSLAGREVPVLTLRRTPDAHEVVGDV